MLQFIQDPAAVCQVPLHREEVVPLTCPLLTQLLVRNIDDFLLVTTKKPIASRFLKVMDDGLPEFGCFVASEKRLTNFDIALHASDAVPPLRTRGRCGITFHSEKLANFSVGILPDFPWCGLIINTETLDVKADADRYEDVSKSRCNLIS